MAPRKTQLLAHCIPGLQSFVAERISQDIAAHIDHVEEGLVVFSALAPDFSTLKRLYYLNNVFLVLEALQGADMETLLLTCARLQNWHAVASAAIERNTRSFRLFLSDENQLISAAQAPLAQLIGQIERHCKLKHSAHTPDTEFWLFRRKGNAAYFCKRLTKNRRTEKDLALGELRPELAHILCLLSEPSPADIFLDPCAGSGAIGFARTAWPYQMIFLSDIDAEKAQIIKKDLKSGKKGAERKGHPVIIRSSDVRRLEKIEDGFVDKAVTDPPWGFFDKEIKNIATFYDEIMAELCRVVKPSGMIVLLTGQRDMIVPLAQDFTGKLTLERRFDILVSGKKAVITTWRRR